MLAYLDSGSGSAALIILLPILFWSVAGALLCGFIGQAKNRGFIGPAIMGALFGIFALIYYAVAPSQQGTGGRGRKVCPGCAESIGQGARVCPHCHHTFANHTIDLPRNTPYWPGRGQHARAACYGCGGFRAFSDQAVCQRCGRTNELLRYFWGFRSDMPSADEVGIS